MEPLEIRRRPSPPQLRIVAKRVVVLVVGVGLLAAGAVALLAGQARGAQGTDAVFLVAVGGFVGGLGARGTLRAWPILRRPVVVRLDAEGVQVLGGAIERPTWSRLAWHDVEAVVVAPVVLDEAWIPETGATTVLRFVPRADELVRGPAPDVYTRVKSTTFGITPVAATMAMVQGATSAFRIPLILDWVRRHRPDVPVHDQREPAGEPGA